MPMYEYVCGHCGEEFEDLVPAGTPDDEIECPGCGREGSSRRKLSTFAVSGSPTGGSLGGGSSYSGGSSGFS
ncbi:MAG: FmdB family zinc ribbon protein [Pseudomonadota bacterium]